MKTATIIRAIAASIIFVMAAATAYSLDLPVKRVKGKQYYYHKVKKGESLYGVSKTLDISIDEILRNNPSAADGIKKGDLLIFPYEEYKEKEPIADIAADTVAVDTVVAEVIEERIPSVALLLPFGLKSEEPSKRNMLALDFYRGFLIAADSLASRDGKGAAVRR